MHPILSTHSRIDIDRVRDHLYIFEGLCLVDPAGLQLVRLFLCIPVLYGPHSACLAIG